MGKEELKEGSFLAELYYAFFNDSLDGVYITSRNGELLDINQAGAEIFGYVLEEEMRGMNVSDLYVSSDDRLKFQEEIEKTGAVKNYELKLRKTSGLIMNCLLTSALWKNQDGDILGYHGIIRDITEQKQKNELILNMIRIVTHDIRSPLTSVIGTLRRAIDGRYGTINENLKITLREQYNVLFHLDSVVQDYLLKSNILEGVKVPYKEIIDLKVDIIDPVLEKFGAEINEKDIKIDNLLGGVPANKILLKCNKTWLRSVYYNLINNAIKYGGKSITIAIGYQDYGGFIRLNVWNSGDSIPDGAKENLFKPFSRFNLNQKGIGLGLFSIKQLIEAHGGKIWYEETNGDHPNFLFTIPKEDIPQE